MPCSTRRPSSARRRMSTARCSSSTTGPTSPPPRAPTEVHLGQDDAAPAQARAVLGDDAIVGLSTHSRTGRRGPGLRRRLHRRGAGPRDADEAGASGRRAGAGPPRRGRGAPALVRHRRPERGQRRGGAGARARDGSWSSARSPRPPTPRRRPVPCAPRSTRRRRPALGQRSRRRERAAEQPPGSRPGPTLARRARNAEARGRLEPLAPGERPAR